MSDKSTNDVYKTLLESTKAIPWSIDWESKQFEYIGPQIKELLGWSSESWATAQDWIDRIHPDFREEITNYCITQSESGVDHEADYPAIAENGDYIWIRDVVHVVRENGVTKKLVGFMFDISERKRLENQLLEANKRLEAYSYQDGLTGLANRRLYDTTLEAEWARAIRNQQPLSMILIDIDFFKEFNDKHGHLEGDICLQRIACTLKTVTTRSTDLCARYGGEEFVMLLPGVNQQKALLLAEKVRESVLALKMQHGKSDVSDYVTISAGVSSLTPKLSLDVTTLFNEADKKLYQAKSNSRNCVMCA
ncbi:MAG: sensor domain-containing diguanylate cyclase [Gammaproteobacteria bacterium]|nr:sensor domain-containing diguanylate cyclase [Gammaproteobacteria bacterium]